MKKLLLTMIALILCGFAYSQTMVENPKVGACRLARLTIVKVELHDSATVLWFRIKDTHGKKINVSGKNYIQPVGSDEKLFVVTAEGIKLDEQTTMLASEEIDYQLTYPGIDKSISKIDIGEASENSGSFFYDVQVRPELIKTIIPLKFEGNWFCTKNGEWEISFFDSVALYKSQVWKCLKYSEKDGLGKIGLKNGSKTLSLFAKAVDDNTCLIGEAPAKLVKFTHKPDESAIQADNEPFKLPVFKSDTAVYCGYIKGFNPRIPQKTGNIYFNEVLTGEQTTFLLTIADDGYFEVKIPLTHSQEVYVGIPFYFDTVYLEPGKTTFQLIDKGNKISPGLFMGDNSRINSDLLKLDDITSFDYGEMISTVYDYSPQQYKDYCQDSQQKDLRSLNEFVQNHRLSTRAVLIKKMNIDYIYSYNLMTYGLNIDAAYRKKNKIPQNQWKLPIKPVEPTGTYYNFLTNNLANNPFAVFSKDYDSFVFSIKMDTSLRSIPKSYIIQEYKENLDQSGRKLTTNEKDLINLMSQIDTISSEKIPVEYNKLIIPFYKDHKQSIDSLYAVSRFLARDEKIRKVFGIQPGLATDIIISQDFYRRVVTEITPYNDKQLKQILQKISTPFIARYLEIKNNESKAKIASNKTRIGYTINETPKKTGGNVFDDIISKYKGKVIYVDFWATWCGPCREGIERIKPLKEEMAAENVVFVYITDHSSPKTTYDNLIPTIKGEHYRVSNDEFNILKAMFKAPGIPHYVLVGKDGKVYNQQNWHPENSELKALLMKHIKE